MYPHLQDIRAGQHITVVYRRQFESHLLVGSYIDHASDNLVVECEDSGRLIHVPVGDVISVHRDPHPPRADGAGR